jgi:hypothetical protein
MLTPLTTRVAHRTMIEKKWSSWDLNSQSPTSQGKPQPRTGTSNPQLDKEPSATRVVQSSTVGAEL